LDGDASEYFCTIARFTLQTGNSLPVFIPVIDTSQIPPPPGRGSHVRAPEPDHLQDQLLGAARPI
jgi:hypothetical protein